MLNRYGKWEDPKVYDELASLREAVARLEDRVYLDRVVLEETQKTCRRLALENSQLRFEAHNPQSKHFPLCDKNLYSEEESCNLECSWNMSGVREAWWQANSGVPMTASGAMPSARLYSAWFKVRGLGPRGGDEVAAYIRRGYVVEDLKVLPVEG